MGDSTSGADWRQPGGWAFTLLPFIDAASLYGGDSGTLVTQDATTIEIEAEALSIPEGLNVSIEGAEEGTQILAGQITLPSGVTLVSDPEMLVVNIVAAPTAEDLAEEGSGEEGEEAGEAAEGGEAEGGEGESAAAEGE